MTRVLDVACIKSVLSGSATDVMIIEVSRMLDGYEGKKVVVVKMSWSLKNVVGRESVIFGAAVDKGKSSRSLDAVAERKLTLDDEGTNDRVLRSLKDIDDKLLSLGDAEMEPKPNVGVANDCVSKSVKGAKDRLVVLGIAVARDRPRSLKEEGSNDAVWMSLKEADDSMVVLGISVAGDRSLKSLVDEGINDSMSISLKDADDRLVIVGSVVAKDGPSRSLDVGADNKSVTVSNDCDWFSMLVKKSMDKTLVVLDDGVSRDNVFRSLRAVDTKLEIPVVDRTGKSVGLCTNCSVVTESARVRLSESGASLVKLKDVVGGIEISSVRFSEIDVN